MDKLIITGGNRLNGEIGVCKIGRHARVASVFPHFGEEDCLRGRLGSGTIFFSWCNLRCQFCQNHDISQTDAGYEVEAEGLGFLLLKMVGHRGWRFSYEFSVDILMDR